MTTYYVDPLNGVDGEWDFGPNPRKLTFNDGAAISSAQSMFGGGSLSPGSNYYGYCYCADSDDFHFGSGTFTVEAWVRFTGTTGNQCIIAQKYWTSHGWGLYWTGTQISFGWSTDGSNWTTCAANWSPATGTWYHIAVDRDSSNNIRVYIDGAVQAGPTAAAVTFNNSTMPLYMGGDGNGNIRVNGYIDDVRVTKGVCRYGGAFTRPTAAFPDNVSGDSNYNSVVLLCHFDAMLHDGTTMAKAWKTLDPPDLSKVTTGDTIRVMQSPDPTLVDSSASWTKGSRSVTLSGAVTLNIDRCETAWTPSTNVSCATDTSTHKEGSACIQIDPASAFTTGKIAYKATGTLDLSGYQQVSFWIRCYWATIPASTLTLNLCTDTAGATSVHAIPIPAIPVTDRWQVVTFDFATNLNSAIQSVALYAIADPAAPRIHIDNIIACKAKSSADSLTLDSLIGKDLNLTWVASTSYAQNAIRRPTKANSTGFLYKVTTVGGGTSGSSEPTWPKDFGATVSDNGMTWECVDIEETWLAIKCINGTAITIDSYHSNYQSYGRGYSGATATAPLYKRQPFVTRLVADSNGWGVSKMNGSDASPVNVIGGYDSTNMSTLVGETWISGSGYGYGLKCGTDSGQYNGNIVWKNLHFFRFHYGAIFSTFQSGPRYTRIENCSFNNSYYGAVNTDCVLKANRIAVCHNFRSLYHSYEVNLRFARIDSAMDYGIIRQVGTFYNAHQVQLTFFAAKQNNCFSDTSGLINARFMWGDLESNQSGENGYGLQANIYHSNCLIDVTDYYTGGGYLTNPGLYGRAIFHNHQRVAGAHFQLVGTYNEIEAVTDVRHTASGFAWRFYGTASDFEHATTQVIARVLCEANTQKTLSAWIRRNNTGYTGGAQGRLFIRGGQLKGVPEDLSTTTNPTVDTWTQYQIQWTPTESGVMEIEFQVWYGNDNPRTYYYVDDLTVS
jgi:hypothetical protein